MLQLYVVKKKFVELRNKHSLEEKKVIVFNFNFLIIKSGKSVSTLIVVSLVLMSFGRIFGSLCLVQTMYTSIPTAQMSPFVTGFFHHLFHDNVNDYSSGLGLPHIMKFKNTIHKQNILIIDNH